VRRILLIVLMLCLLPGLICLLVGLQLFERGYTFLAMHRRFFVAMMFEAALLLLILHVMNDTRRWRMRQARLGRFLRGARYNIIQSALIFLMAARVAECIYKEWPFKEIAINALVLCALIYQVVATGRAKSKIDRLLRGFCVTCGYNLTGNTSGTCPECGNEIAEPGRIAIAKTIVSQEEVAELVPVADLVSVSG
jgi:hypothetical protein